MPINAKYKGPARDVGRFGHLRMGDMVALTDKEAACIRATPDILKWWEFQKDGKGAAVNTFVETVAPEKEVPEQVKARLDKDSKEKQRVERLNSVNDPRNAELQNLSEKSFAQLMIMVQTLATQGIEVVVTPTMGHRDLVAAILAAKYPRA